MGGVSGLFAAVEVVRVLTLNFNSEGVPNDGHHVIRDLRFSAMVDFVRREDPDIILIQEGWNYGKDASVAVTLARAIGYDVAYRLDMGAPFYMYDSDAVLAKKRFRMTEERDVRLPHSAPEIGNGKSWVINTGRVSYGVGARLTLPDGEPLYAYSAHLIGTSDAQRTDQIRALDEAISAQIEGDRGDPRTAKIIVGGDMNSTPGTSAMAYLRSVGYEDSWLAAHPDDEGCTNCSMPMLPGFNPFTLGAKQIGDQSLSDMERRIDYVYSRGGGRQTLASTLEFTGPYDGVWMSDHYGVMATLAFGPGAGSVPPGKVPNPVSAAPDDLPPTTVLELTDALFAGHAPALGEVQVAGARGVTIVNRTSAEVEVHLRGPGKVYTAPDTELQPGHVSAFVFDRPGTYTYELEDESGGKLKGRIRVLKGMLQ